MYLDRYSAELTRTLAKLKKRDPARYEQVDKKIKEILENPEHGYKTLRYSMQDMNRVHIGHFVLTFRIDRQNKIVWFDDFDHHDNIYRK